MDDELHCRKGVGDTVGWGVGDLVGSAVMTPEGSANDCDRVWHNNVANAVSVKERAGRVGI